MRSKLFVPGARPEFFDKAMASQADAISFDLEDSVLEQDKVSARHRLSDWLASRHSEKSTNKQIVVRVNAMDTAHFIDDINAIVQNGVHTINIPKPANAQAVRDACAIIADAEKANAVQTPLRVLLNIETPQALREAALLAKADPRVMGLQVGLGDLFEPLGIDRTENNAIAQVLFAVRMAAAEAGIPAFDGAYANVKNTDGFIEEARLAKRMGFSGKSCIHPSQIVFANQVFMPSLAEIDHARKVLFAQANQAQAGNSARGAFLVDGKMIDKPFLLRAAEIVRIVDHTDSPNGK